MAITLKANQGTFLVVQWLRVSIFTAEVQFLVRELRSHKLCSVAKKQQANKKRYQPETASQEERWIVCNLYYLKSSKKKYYPLWRNNSD